LIREVLAPLILACFRASCQRFLGDPWLTGLVEDLMVSSSDDDPCGNGSPSARRTLFPSFFPFFRRETGDLIQGMLRKDTTEKIFEARNVCLTPV
jgi:hypothetical protein